MLIAVDFDGTIVTHKYPAIGEEIPFAVDTLKMLRQDGHRLILWSVREGQLLEDALQWCRERDWSSMPRIAIIPRRPPITIPTSRVS